MLIHINRRLRDKFEIVLLMANQACSVAQEINLPSSLAIVERCIFRFRFYFSTLPPTNTQFSNSRKWEKRVKIEPGTGFWSERSFYTVSNNQWCNSIWFTHWYRLATGMGQSRWVTTVYRLHLSVAVLFSENDEFLVNVTFLMCLTRTPCVVIYRTQDAETVRLSISSSVDGSKNWSEI